MSPVEPSVRPRCASPVQPRRAVEPGARPRCASPAQPRGAAYPGRSFDAKGQPGRDDSRLQGRRGKGSGQNGAHNRSAENAVGNKGKGKGYSARSPSPSNPRSSTGGKGKPDELRNKRHSKGHGKSAQQATQEHVGKPQRAESSVVQDSPKPPSERAVNLKTIEEWPDLLQASKQQTSGTGRLRGQSPTVPVGGHSCMKQQSPNPPGSHQKRTRSMQPRRDPLAIVYTCFECKTTFRSHNMLLEHQEQEGHWSATLDPGRTFVRKRDLQGIPTEELDTSHDDCKPEHSNSYITCNDVSSFQMDTPRDCDSCQVFRIDDDTPNGKSEHFCQFSLSRQDS